MASVTRQVARKLTDTYLKVHVKTCKKCSSLFDGVRCKHCAATTRAKRIAANPEAEKVKAAQRRLKNREATNEARAKLRQEDGGRMKGIADHAAEPIRAAQADMAAVEAIRINAR